MREHPLRKEKFANHTIAYLDHNAELRTLARMPVGSDVVPHAVGKLACVRPIQHERAYVRRVSASPGQNHVVVELVLARGQKVVRTVRGMAMRCMATCRL